jgi:hypothetical protein
MTDQSRVVGRDTMESNLKSCALLSKKQRESTPELFARYLVNTISLKLKPQRISALFLQKGSIYHTLERCDCWTREMNALTYSGPHPVICHPPCGPWGKYVHNCCWGTVGGIIAMEMVHCFGGVVEQPLGSRLFDLYGEFGVVEKVNQGDYGHLAKKPTELYWVLSKEIIYPPHPMEEDFLPGHNTLKEH